MNFARLRSTVLRTATASVLATAGLAAGLPGIAHASAGDHTVKVTVVNDSSSDFTRTRYRVTQGVWDVRPFASISAGESDWLRTKSKFDQSGTSGNITFKSGSGGTFTITWDNPYGDENSFDCSVSEDLSCDTDIQDNSATAEVTFTIG